MERERERERERMKEREQNTKSIAKKGGQKPPRNISIQKNFLLKIYSLVVLTGGC